MKPMNKYVHPSQALFISGEPKSDWVPGLSKRELFAAMFLQGLLANPNLLKDDLKDQTMIELPARIADLMLKHLEDSNDEKTG